MTSRRASTVLLLALCGCQLAAERDAPGGARRDEPDPVARAEQRTYWPTDGWRFVGGANFMADQGYTIEPARLQLPACQDFIQYSLFSRGDERAKAGVRTDAFVVVKSGELSFEYYRAPYDEFTTHSLWSASKSVSNALLGAAIQRYQDSQDPRLRIALEDKLASFYPGADRSANEYHYLYYDVTLSDLLLMGSNFDWVESYKAGPDSSVTRMLYTDGFDDMAGFANRTIDMRPEGPGQLWNYSSGNINMLMGALKQVYGEDYNDMPWTNLFNRIGMFDDLDGDGLPDREVKIDQDAAGTFVGSSYVHATPRDMAKLGYLFLNDGLWGEPAENADGWSLFRVLPEGWVNWTRDMAAPYRKDATIIHNTTLEGVFGASFWLNLPAKGLPAPYPSVPEDMYAAMGHYGQYIFILPSLDMVIARTGDDTDFTTDVDKMVRLAIDCFSDPLPGM
jgi:CubicO group peptidase (beta-lactamase class C family)